VPVAFYPDPKISLRSELIASVEDGSISIETANALAEKHDLGALVGPADVDMFSAAREPYWSLLMVMGWIMSRDYEVVQNLYGPFVKRSTYWKQRDGGPPVATKLMMSDLSDLEFAYEHLGVGAFPPPTSFSEAWLQLRDKLAHTDIISVWLWDDNKQAMTSAAPELVASVATKPSGPTQPLSPDLSLRFLRREILAQWPGDDTKNFDLSTQRHYITAYLRELEENERERVFGVFPKVQRNMQIWEGVKVQFAGLSTLPLPSEKTFQRAIKDFAENA
jgi:hypothetical protein|tara:strand:+ start:1876 stop:2706 length:831 start_codon:yes stop_codon:yes gene_type:complete